MENPIKMDDLGGKPTIFGIIQINCDTFLTHLRINSKKVLKKLVVGRDDPFPLFFGRLGFNVAFLRAEARSTEDALGSCTFSKWDRDKGEIDGKERLHPGKLT